MKPPGKAPLPRTARIRLRHLLVRLAMLLVLVLSLGLLWWSLSIRLAPVSRAYQDKTREMSELSDQVDQLKTQWPATRTAQVATQYLDAQGLLFAGPDAVSGWGQVALRQLAPLGFETTLHWGPPQTYPQAGQKLSITRASLKLLPVRTAGETDPPYRRLVSFARSFERARPRVDLLELSVSGHSNAIAQADMVVELWSQERSSK